MRPKADDQQHPYLIVFLHIPKTGGVTLRHVLRDQYGPERTVIVRGRLVSPDLEPLQHLDGRVAAICGHFAFGIHQRIQRSAAYLTMLRDPIERTVSHFLYERRNPQPGTSPPSDLFSFVEERALAANIHTRLIGGSIDGVDGPVDGYTLDTAKRRLGRFAVVGLTDRYDESLLLMRDRFGWSLPFHVRLNTRPDRPSLEDLPGGAVAAIVERNSLDVELYKWAADRFEQHIRSLGKGFSARAEAFRLLNNAFGRRAAAAKRRVSRLTTNHRTR